MLFTLVNIAYGALAASLTRDMDEITRLTAVRIFLANAGCLAAMAGVPLLVSALGGGGELVTDPAEIGPALRRAFDSGVPYLVNIVTDPENVYPRKTMGV